MAGHTFIARIRAFLSRLFKRPKKESAPEMTSVPWHITEACCSCRPELEGVFVLLANSGEYKRPRSLESYEREEKEKRAFEADMREAREKWEQRKEPERKLYAAIGYRPDSIYGSDDEEFSYSEEGVAVMKKYHWRYTYV